VLLNLWATWCAPCRREMPDLDRLQAELGGERFEVVAISIDKGGPDKPQRFLEEVKATKLNFYHDPTGRLGTLLKAYGLPTTILVDAQGRELGRLAGPAEWGSEDAKKLIKAVLEKGSADS
ncbi:MAG: TlpA family protein disulfide reductase, partial [Alphaproteobacteria bacterium]